MVSIRKLFALLVLLTLCGITAADVASIGNPDALRHIVQDQCVPNWLATQLASPCVRVQLSGQDNSGYAVLHDRKGGAHYLLIPTETVTGIESPSVLADTPNYFAAAWQSRDQLQVAAGFPVSRAAVGLAINRQSARSQNQLHIHIECLKPQVYAALDSGAENIGDTWSPINIAGATFMAMRVMGEELAQVNPFKLLADTVPDAKTDMGAYTLIVAGMEFQTGPGFVLLTGRSTPSGELLLDSTCEVAKTAAPEL